MLRLRAITLISVCLLSPVARFASAASLLDAIRHDDLATLRAESRSRTELERRGPGGATPLLTAAAIGSPEAVAALLEAGADVHAVTDLGATALIWAAGDARKSRLLVEAGANVTARSAAGRTPLLVAAARDGASAVVELLLERGADPHAADDMGVTPLVSAALAGDTESVRLLLARGADANRADKAGMTALQYAAANSDLGMVKLLLAHGARVDDANTFGGAVKHGDIALKGLTPLMLAAPSGDAAVIAALLDAGADVNARDSRGMTPLMLAVAGETQDRRVVKLLLARGADAGAVSQAGETALDWAAKFGDPDVLALLQRAGAERRAKPMSAPPPVERPRDARLAAERALELVQASSAELFRQSGCVSCHHQNMAMIAAAEARAAGLHLDAELAADAARQVIAQWSVFAPGLLERVDPPGSPDTPTFSLFAMAMEGLQRGAGAGAVSAADALFANIAAQQRRDGSWRMMGFPRAPMEEGHFARTAMAVRALSAYVPAGRRAEMAERSERARAWLLAAKPRTTDDHVWRLLGLHWTKAPESHTRRAAKKLLALQRADGGWGPNPHLGSDAYATATALWALRVSGMASAESTDHGRGVDYLRRTQRGDGSWFVASRSPKFQPYFESGFPHGPDQWISMAATSWAAAALAPAAGLDGVSD